LDHCKKWKGKDEKDQQALETLAINKSGQYGRWAFVEISNPWNAKDTIKRVIANK
jgi:hypothetical protein